MAAALGSKIPELAVKSHTIIHVYGLDDCVTIFDAIRSDVPLFGPTRSSRMRDKILGTRQFFIYRTLWSDICFIYNHHAAHGITHG